MSGRLYDRPGKPFCNKCGSEMLTSYETNFNGPKCKNKNCDGGLMDASYFVGDEQEMPDFFQKLGLKPPISFKTDSGFILLDPSKFIICFSEPKKKKVRRTKAEVIEKRGNKSALF